MRKPNRTIFFCFVWLIIFIAICFLFVAAISNAEYFASIICVIAFLLSLYFSRPTFNRYLTEV